MHDMHTALKIRSTESFLFITGSFPHLAVANGLVAGFHLVPLNITF